ncbi:hypothetical protein CKM354_000994400 [Cercospora kikuchii]|uniref:Uncharacterized protein n=1 Tax=Cercospora kikuchii TaxID=84275 RepID=A0A9P3CUD9_9PEZI|nr:uncharacterized protein CKM354_000994400 [Cercospora kikuchii]GIZ46835.1 hypothetical protein CKM354_000994400 [Cercospora kikuchii]
MASIKSTSVVILLAATCAAQSLPRQPRELVADITLAEQSAVNSSIRCGRYFDDAMPQGLVVRIASNFTSGTCLNIAETFSSNSYPNDTISEFEGVTESCSPLNSTCYAAIQAIGLNLYSPEVNYTHVEISFRTSNATKDFTLKAFAGDRCEEDASEPWFLWGGCSPEDRGPECEELPYNVKSLKVERMASDNSTECLIAAERGAGARMGQAGIAAVVGGAVVAGLMAVV